MKSKLWALVAVLLVPTLLAETEISVAERSTSKIVKGRTPFPDRYIVVLKDELLKDDVEVVVDDLRGVHGGVVSHVFKHAFKGFVVSLPRPAAERLSQHPLVRLVEEDGWVEVASTDEIVAATATGTSYGAQLDRIDDRYGLDGTYQYCWGGGGVRAYVVDTGIWAAHGEFRSLSCDGTYGPTRVVAGYNYHTDPTRGTADNPCPFDQQYATPTTMLNSSHGTAVASMLGGLDNGAAPHVTLVSVRVFDCSGGNYLSFVEDGLNWIAANGQRPAVVNMSFAYEQGDSSRPLSSIDVATSTLVNSGYTVVAAAGNFRKDAALFSPARVEGVITAGAVASSDEIWIDATKTAGTQDSGSNIGSAVDIFAVGSNVKAAHFGGADKYREAGKSGTSFASPLVAGIAARWLTGYPTERGFSLNPYEMTISKRILEGSGGATSGAVSGELCVIPGNCAANKILYKATERCRPICP